MKGNQLFTALAIGIGAILVVSYYQKRKRKQAIVNNPNALEGIAVSQETAVFRRPIQQQYDIVIPQTQVSRKVAALAKELTEGRYEIQIDRAKAPLYI